MSLHISHVYFNILLYLFLKWFQIQEGENLSTFSTSIVFPNDAFLRPDQLKSKRTCWQKKHFTVCMLNIVGIHFHNQIHYLQTQME